MSLKQITEKIDCKYCRDFEATLHYAQETADFFGEDFWKDFRDHAWWNHWYEKHYNCAYCGEWIPPHERDLLIVKDHWFEIHPKYNEDGRPGLLRMHESCTQKVAS